MRTPLLIHAILESDEELRELERRVKAGDKSAKEPLRIAKNRHGIITPPPALVDPQEGRTKQLRKIRSSDPTEKIRYWQSSAPDRMTDDQRLARDANLRRHLGPETYDAWREQERKRNEEGRARKAAKKAAYAEKVAPKLGKLGTFLTDRKTDA